MEIWLKNQQHYNYYHKTYQIDNHFFNLKMLVFDSMNIERHCNFIEIVK